jgi:gamma-glutamyltranspeptidase / glutathione hydrolase
LKAGNQSLNAPTLSPNKDPIENPKKTIRNFQMQFNYTNHYPTIRPPLFARNIVATSQPLAVQAGMQIMHAGGNAVDAAIAAAAALTICEPVSNGLGSDCFALVWAGGKLHGLNSSGVAPQAWDCAYFDAKHGGKVPMRGWDSVTVPGAVAGWAALHERFGKLDFAQCLLPAIRLAREGFGVSVILAHKWAAQIPHLASQPGFAQAFMPRGRAPAVGERFVFESAAKGLELIAQSKGREYYEGEIAQALVTHSRANNGSLSLSDLAAYKPEWVQPIEMNYRGYTVHEIPPNGQGIAALMALGMLEHFDLKQYPVDSILSRHIQIEAMKAAFADVYQYVADPRDMQSIRASDLLDSNYLQARAKQIDVSKAKDWQHGLPPAGGTIYLTTADQSGQMVSFIQSNYMGFGSGIVEPRFGISLQNRGHGFTTDKNHPNCVAPQKRPFHTIIPAFLSRQGEPQMSFGVMGGNMQPQGHLQTVVRMVDYEQSPQTACDAPRWKVNRGLSVDAEVAMEPEVRQGLIDLGHRLESIPDPYMDFGSGQFIARLSNDLADGYVAASDARRDGQASGF